MIPKNKKKELHKLDLHLSTQLSKLFLEDSTKIIDDKNKEKLNELPILQLTEILSKIDKLEVPKQINFFEGGENIEFENSITSVGLSTDSIEFLDLLQSNFCQEILIQNELKIHIETGNIFFNNLDTNESIYDFFQKQENIGKVNIHSDQFTFTDSYEDYFERLVHGFKQGDDQKYDVLTNKDSKYLFYCLNDYSQRVLEPIKPVRHSVITDDDIALDVIQNENWQYFIETILKTCQTNNGGINNTVELKNIKLIKNSVENITICKQRYQNFYDQTSQYLTNTIKNLPADKINKIDQDLQRNNYFVNLVNMNAFSDHNILDTFCHFFQNHGRVPGSQELIIVPNPEISNLIKAQKIISTNEPYQKFSSTDARGLVAIQAITALNIYFSRRLETSKQALAEFLHNMSHQALNKDNDLTFIQFGRTADLIIELILVLLDRNTRSVNVTNVINDNIKNELNNDRLTFDVPTETKTQDEMNKILQNKIKPPTPPPPYSPPTANEIKTERERINAEFLKTSLLLHKDQLDASNEPADQTNKKIIKDIIDPTPGFFIDDKC